MASLHHDRYEHLVPEDTTLPLHQLCLRCDKLTIESQLLKDMAKGVGVIAGTTETVHFCAPDELKSGYLSGCHLCALLWTNCMGELLESNCSRPLNPKERLILKIHARDLSPPTDAATETSGQGRLMYVINAFRKARKPTNDTGPFGTVVMFFAAVREHEDLLKKPGGRSEIYVVPPSCEYCAKAGPMG